MTGVDKGYLEGAVMGEGGIESPDKVHWDPSHQFWKHNCPLPISIHNQWGVGGDWG